MKVSQPIPSIPASPCVLAIDVGLLNLAVCCCTKSDGKYSILFWDVINVLGDPGSGLGEKCKGLLKSGKVCNKNAKYTGESNQATLNESLTVFQCQSYYCKLHTKDLTNVKEIKKPKVKQFNFQEIALRINGCLGKLVEQHPAAFAGITKVLIELQPNKNNKMKFTSHIIFGKLVDIFPSSVPVKFIGAKNKLRHFQGPAAAKVKNTYANRKKAAIEQCTWYLEHQINDPEGAWKEYLAGCPKKDDLADVIRYCVNDLH